MSSSWVQKLNESDSRLHKEDVLRQALEAATLGNDISIRFLTGLVNAYNPYLTYGVRQIPETQGIIEAENPWDELSVLMQELATRRVTGHAARDALNDIAVRFDSDEWNNFLAPILRRDLRSGISAKTINKVLSGTDYEVPVFECQLATSCEDRPEMRGEKRLEPKLDGARVLMYISVADSGIYATSYSRNGIVYENFKHIEDQILENVWEMMAARHLVAANLTRGFILDGEIVSDSFQQLMRQTRRKSNVNATDSNFYIFDIIPKEEFIRGVFPLALSRRIELLHAMRGAFDKMPNVDLLPHLSVNLDDAEGHNRLERYAKDMVAAGFEGIMIKDVNSPYISRRTTDWLKWKPTITVDLQVVGMEEGTGRNKGRLGALICNGVDGDKEITVNVGSGFSDKDRDSIWTDRELVIGSMVEIRCDAITMNKDGTYSLRFPRFVRFRDDK